MYSFFKKLISALLVLYLVALVLNLKVGGRPTRDWTQDAWNSRGVQKVYTTVKDRVLALIRKDISVEEVFQPKPGNVSTSASKPIAEKKPPENIKTINMEKLSDKDRQALDDILNKASK